MKYLFVDIDFLSANILYIYNYTVISITHLNSNFFRKAVFYEDSIYRQTLNFECGGHCDWTINWTGGDSTIEANPTRYRIDRDLVITANFEEKYTLIFSPEPAEGGKVKRTPLPDADGFYEEGTEVLVEPVANPGYVFFYWKDPTTGKPVNTEDSYTITIGENSRVLWIPVFDVE